MMYKRLWLVLLAAMLMMSLTGGVMAETNDRVVVTINGQELRYSQIEAVAASYGVDAADEADAEELWQLAAEACVESILIEQDMQQLGMFDDMDGVVLCLEIDVDIVVRQHDSDDEGFFGSRKGCHGQNHRQSQEQGNQLLHGETSFKFMIMTDATVINPCGKTTMQPAP